MTDREKVMTTIRELEARILTLKKMIPPPESNYEPQTNEITITVCGPLSCGKTTLINILTSKMSNDRRFDMDRIKFIEKVGH